MLKIYGSMLCPDCVQCRKDLDQAGVDYEYLDFSESLANLKAFLKLRDTKTVFEHAGVAYQSFFNRSDAQSGGTLGSISLSHVSVLSVDIGIAQLAMHSACECFAKTDYEMMTKALTEFYSSEILVDENGIKVR